MSFKEIIGIALASLRVNKLRSVLTMLGITIGVFSVIGVMTAVSALQSSIESGLSFLGSNMFQFAKFPQNFNAGGSARDKYQNRRNVTFEEAKHFSQLMEEYSDVVCPKMFHYDGVQATYAGRKTNPSLTLAGTNQHFTTANQYKIAYGRNLTAEDVDLARNVVVIGKTIETRLFPNESPLSKTVKMGGHTYTIVGVFAEKGSSFGNSQDDMVIIPITKFMENYGTKGRTVNIAIQAPSQAEYNATLDHAVGAMRKARGLKPEQQNDFEVYSNDSLVSAFNNVANIVAAGAFVISGIALLAAGIGIMNIMLVSVTERTKEIGIRKSIGAKKKNILTQFLCESVTISLAGGLFGILFGVLGGDLIAWKLNASIIFPVGWTLISVGVCTAIGVGFGLYPAYKASSLDPIEALRFE